MKYSLYQLQEGTKETIEWAKAISQEEIKGIEVEVRLNEDSYLARQLLEIKRIKDNTFIPLKDLRALAKKAFLEENETAKETLSNYLGFEGDEKVTNGASLAYMIYAQNSSGFALAYSLIAGVDTDVARTLNDDEDLKSPWEFSNYNSDREVVFTEMIDTLLYEDSQSTKWKKAPHTILRQLIEEGHSHPGIPAFLEKYKDKKWAQVCINKVKKDHKRKKAANGCLSGLGIVGLVFGLIGGILMIWFVGAFVIGISSVFGLSNGIEGSTGKEMFVTGVCVCAIPISYEIYKWVKQKC